MNQPPLTLVAAIKKSNYFRNRSTRISNPGDSGGVVVSTDNGSKLFAIPVACRSASDDPSLRRSPYYWTTVGFAFAGSMLAATQTYATAATLLQNLITAGSKDPPLLRDIAEFVRKIAEHFSKNILSSNSGKIGKFESSVFGWCPHESRFEIFVLRPERTETSFSVVMTESRPDEIVTLGSGSNAFNEELSRIRNGGDIYGCRSRLPKLAIEAMVRGDSMNDVGGSISIGIATKFGFDLYSWVSPIEFGKPAARLTFNGIDIAKIGSIGHCFVGINGMV